MTEFLTASSAEIAQELNTSLTEGLTSPQAAQSLAREGKNELPQPKPKPWYWVFFLALTEPLHIVLMIAAIISVIAPRIGHWSERISGSDFIDFCVILFIVLLDATLETVQTMRARRSVQALKKLTQPTAIVIRDGKQMEINAVNIVRGDIVVLDAGKFIPADVRFFDASDLRVDESILTGESVPVTKTVTPQSKTRALGDMLNLGFSGTFVTNGRGQGIVIRTGIDTEIGKINEEINAHVDEKTPLEKKLTRFSYWVSIVAVILATIMFVALYFDGQKAKWSEYLMVSITIAIGIIPESLPAVVSVALSVTTKRMAQSNVIVKKLSSVETLGSVNVICTDKTGTLTQNKMTIKALLWNNEIISSEEFIREKLTMQKDLFLKALVLPNDSVTDNKQRIGDPTEVALVDFAELMHVDELASRERYPRQDEIPFDSERKLMTTVNLVNGKNLIFTKGALEEILKISTRIYLNNKIVPLTGVMRKKILDNSKRLSNEALRILGFAFAPKTGRKLESGLVFLGACGMIDPVRPKAIRTIKDARKAGIRVVMITGDHAITALAIARDLDLAQSTNQVLSADELDKLSNRQLGKIIDNVEVFARVNPEDKVKIVQILEKKGNIVAMTGDGVNDGPSLVAANIGVAMGKNGTDVAKDAADVILTDDNFATIMRGVDEGRSVYQKIRQAIVLLLGFNLANVITIFVLALLNKDLPPLKAVDILYLNLIVESFLAIAMGMGPVDSSLMKLAPRRGRNNLLSGLWSHILVIGISLSLTNILAFYVGMWSLSNTEANHLARLLRARTVLFISASFAPVFLAQVIKLTNWKSSKKIPWLISKPLIYAGLFVMALNLIFIFTPFLGNRVLGLIGYGNQGWNAKSWWLFFVGFGLSLLPAIVVLSINAAIFFSYHYLPEKRRWNRELVIEMISKEKKNKK